MARITRLSDHSDKVPMYLVPVILLVALLVVVFIGNSMKKKGSMAEGAYQTLVSVASVLVTVAALVIMYLRLRG